MLTFFTTMQIFIAFSMIFWVLMQKSPNDGMGGFSSQSAAANRAGKTPKMTFSRKITAILALAFFVNSLVIGSINKESNMIIKKDMQILNDQDEEDDMDSDQ